MKTVWLILGCLLLTGSMYAQNYFEKGNKYVGFEVNRTPGLHGGYFWDDRFAFHGGVILNINGLQDVTGFGLQFGIDRYAPYNQLTSFAGGTLTVGINPVAYSGSFYKGTQIVLDGHWGLNLFVVNSLAVTGKVGMELVFDSPNGRGTQVSVNTFSSAIEIRFFL